LGGGGGGGFAGGGGAGGGFNGGTSFTGLGGSQGGASFDAGSAATYTVAIAGGDGSVSITAVPEPMSLGLLALCGTALPGRRRRRAIRKT
jgi:hypothetical protein